MSAILYIEDNPQNMRLVRKILNHAGYQMIEAENGLDGLFAAEKQQPSLILVDVNLPDIDGLEVTARLRANPATEAMTIIALTANAMVGDREKALQAGCDDYLPKPISRADLLHVVQGYLPISTPS